jgi:hypothetical protein
VSMGQKWSKFLGRVPTVQMVIGLAAGIISIGGAVYSLVFTSNSVAGQGEIVAVIRENGSNKAVRDATVEVLTQDNAVVTRFTSRPEGRAKMPVKAGGYRLRVAHPSLGQDTRQVLVRPGQTTEIHVSLGPPPAQLKRPPPAQLKRPPPAATPTSASPPASKNAVNNVNKRVGNREAAPNSRLPKFPSDLAP